MQKNNFLLLTTIFLLSSLYHSGIDAHGDIKKWRQAARRGTLSSNRHIFEMQTMNADEFKLKIAEMRRNTKDHTDENVVNSMASKKTRWGFCKLGLSSLFGVSGCFLTFKAIPASLQLEDEQTRFAATFWSAIGAIGCFGGSYFFGKKGCNQVNNNFSIEKVKQRLGSHSANLAQVEENFNRINNIKIRDNIEELD